MLETKGTTGCNLLIESNSLNLTFFIFLTIIMKSLQRLKRKSRIMNEKDIVELYTKNNKSLRQIAKIYDVDHHQIKRILLKNNIKISKRKSSNINNKICPVCKTKFTTYKSVDKKFCCTKCQYQARTLGITKRKVSKPYVVKKSKYKEEKICLFCSNKYISSIKKQKYCSSICFHKSRKVEMKGNKNPSYVDGRSKNKKCYRGENWEEIRKEVYERDYWTCQKCKVHCDKTHKIQAHHKIPYKISKDNSLDNLVTLCVSCHKIVEEEYKKEGKIYA